MLLPQTSIERAFDGLFERIRRDPILWCEFQASRSEFLGSKSPGSAPRAQEMAERRHAEWFLLERASVALDVVPAQGLESDSDDSGIEIVLGREALLGSFASVFEITGVRAGEGVWVRDLAGLGEYPLEEAEASRALEAGDLLVGRVFPVGDALYRISHASGFFRDARLLAAVRRDLERAREGRRGVLRLSQRELESMFFGIPPATPSAANGKPRASESISGPIEQARRCLAEGGLNASEIEDVLAELASDPFDPAAVIPGAGDRLGEILSLLAFETDIDLERARRALAEAWPVLSDPPSSRPESKETRDRPRVQRVGRKQAAGKAARKVERALSEFDARRAKGEDLDALFASLECELALEPEATSEDASAPDFPGVVGAMVVEFLWDMERERGAEAARRLAAIANFAEFAKSQGVFENLGQRDLLLFACLWLPEHAPSGAEAQRWFEALVEFAAWSEERHAVLLATALEPLRAELASSLPRVCSANSSLRARLGALRDGGEMLGFEGGRSARTPKGEARTVEIAREAAEHVEAGDFLRAVEARGAEWLVVCIYPPQTAKLAELA